MHIDDLELIGKGSTASVYKYGDDKVLKVYDSKRYRDRPDFVKREADITRAVCESGLPAADCRGLIDVDGFHCAIYDMAEGEPLGDKILAEPAELGSWVRRMADMAKAIHSTRAVSEVMTPVRLLSKLFPYMEAWLDGKEMERYRELAGIVPDRGYMVHTDFHFDNVLVKDGMVRLIDVGGMSHGHPVYDLLSLYRRAYFPDETRSKLSPEANTRFYRIFLNEYFGDALTPEAFEVLEEILAFLTKIIRVSVPCAKGAPDTFDEEERRQRTGLLKDLLNEDPHRLRQQFERLDKMLFGTVFLKGRIDSENAHQTEEELNERRPDIIDASLLSYISSAGLRVLLRYSKGRSGKLTVASVSDPVYEILETTGFAQIFNVTRRLHEVGIKDCKLLGRGYCASVYRLDSERVIKVYDAPRHAYDPEAVKTENEISRKVFLSGLPSVICYDTVKCNGYFAGIYELVDGNTMGNVIYEDPSLLEPLTVKMAQIGRRMNSTDAAGFGLGPATYILTRRRSRMLPYLTDEETALVDALIRAVPDRGKLVHGDYHVENVMVQNGEIVLIDVGGMSCGHPVFDLLCLYMKTTESGYLETKLDMEACSGIWECYIREYFGETLTDALLEDLTAILRLFTDIYMLPAYCAIAASTPEPSGEALERIRERVKGISAYTPERLKKLFDSTDTLYEHII
jgi:uncharacterized protein (TIGR02172 family)